MPPYNKNNNRDMMHRPSLMLVMELNDMVGDNKTQCKQNTSLSSHLHLDDNLVGCCRTVSFEEPELVVCAKTAPSKKKTKKKVTFSTVQEREYDVILGDHPFCPDWLPLSLGWTYQQSADTTSVSLYEKKKDAKRTSIHPRKLTLEEREARLQEVYGIC